MNDVKTAGEDFFTASSTNTIELTFFASAIVRNILAFGSVITVEINVSGEEASSG
jgi:hypothetical protein